MKVFGFYSGEVTFLRSWNQHVDWLIIKLVKNWFYYNQISNNLIKPCSSMNTGMCLDQVWGKKSPWSYFLGFVSWLALKEDSTCGDYWTGKTPRCGEIVLLILYNFYYLTFYFTRWAWTPRTAPAICQQRRKLRLKSHLMTSRLRLSFCVFIAQEDIVHGLKYTFSFAFLKGSTLVIIIWMELHTGGISGCAFSSCFKPL